MVLIHVYDFVKKSILKLYYYVYLTDSIPAFNIKFKKAFVEYTF